MESALERLGAVVCLFLFALPLAALPVNCCAPLYLFATWRNRKVGVNPFLGCKFCDVFKGIACELSQEVGHGRKLKSRFRDLF